MRLDDFLKNAESAHLAPTKSIAFKAIGMTKDRQPFIFDATAQLVFVDEELRTKALREARQEETSEDLIRLSLSYKILLLALRDATDPVVQFANDVTQLKRCLVSPVATRLMGEYSRFLDAEFPDVVDDAQASEVAAEAEKK